MSGWIGDLTHNVRALRSVHGLEHIHTLVDRITLSEINGHQILVDIGEHSIHIEEILVKSSVPDNGRGKFFPSVNRVVKRKLYSALTHIARGIMNVIHGDKARKITDQTVNERLVLVGEKLLRAAVGHLPRIGHDRVQTPDRVSL